MRGWVWSYCKLKDKECGSEECVAFEEAPQGSGKEGKGGPGASITGQYLACAIARIGGWGPDGFAPYQTQPDRFGPLLTVHGPDAKHGGGFCWGAARW